jgi:hypothetical protein
MLTGKLSEELAASVCRVAENKKNNASFWTILNMEGAVSSEMAFIN